MTGAFKTFADARAQLPVSASVISCSIVSMAAARWVVPAILSAIFLFGTATIPPAFADGLARGAGAYSSGNYARAVRELTPGAFRGDARAQAQLGFMYENGFGVPQNYAAAADLYQSAAAQGDVFAQSRLGLSYDKGHAYRRT